MILLETHISISAMRRKDLLYSVLVKMAVHPAVLIAVFAVMILAIVNNVFLRRIFFMKEVMELNIESVRRGRHCTFKAAGLMLSGESVGYILFIAILAVAVVFGWSTLLDFGRYVTQMLEMSTIQSAATTYAGHRRDGAGPTTMQELIDGVSATDSITGAPIKNLINPDSGRFKGGVYKDAFGSDFVFGENANGNRYIASPGIDRQPGTDDDLYAYY